MANNNKKQTLGFFDITGYIAVTDKTFQLNNQSKNNSNYFYSVFNPMIEDGNGKSMFIRFMDGFDKVNGKTIYAKPISGENVLKIAFADRNNENILKEINDNSFVKVGIKKEMQKDDKGKEFMAWTYKKFLAVYDIITFLQAAMELGKKYKVRMTGRTKYNEYNGEIQKQFDLQSIFLLDGNEGDKPYECKFSFSQNVLVENNAVDKLKWDTENVAKLNAKVFQIKSKDKKTGEYIYETLPLEFIIRANTDKDKETYERVIEKFFTVDETIVRRIDLDCLYNSGYIASNVTEDDLPQEALDLINDGLYSKEEVMKMYANRERVDEMIIVRPIIRRINDKPQIDYSDDEFTKEDLINTTVELPTENETNVETPQNTENLMAALENL